MPDGFLPRQSFLGARLLLPPPPPPPPREKGTKKTPRGRGSTKAVGLSEFSSNAEAIFPAKSLSDGTSRTIAGGAVFYAPPKTHTKSKYHQPHRAMTHQERGAPEPPPERAF